MADDKKAVDDQQYDDDGKPIVVPPKADDEGESDSEKEEKKEDKGGDDADESKKVDTAKDFDDDADPVIPVRKSSLQHIIARKNDKIKKLQSKADDKGEDADLDEEDDESDLSEDAKGAIEKEVSKRIAPIVETLITGAEEKELKELFASDPEAKKYEKHIKAYMGHEAYKGVSPEVIYHHLAFNSAQAVGAKKKKVADLEANQNKNGGRGLIPKGGVSELPTAEDIAEMSEADFEKMEADARQGKYVNK